MYSGLLGDVECHVFIRPLLSKLEPLGYSENGLLEGSLDVLVRRPFRIQKIVEILRCFPVLKTIDSQKSACGDQLDGRKRNDKVEFSQFFVKGLKSCD